MKREDTNRITNTGLQDLKTELEQRISEKRVELKATIEDMRDKGDLSENDGYTLALDGFESNERRIAELNNLIENADVIKSSASGKISLGSTVIVNSTQGETEFTVVGQAEANPIENKISEETPLGKALIGKSKGDIVNVDLPRGEIEYKIIKVK